jgi:hypothetical protein
VDLEHFTGIELVLESQSLGQNGVGNRKVLTTIFRRFLNKIQSHNLVRQGMHIYGTGNAGLFVLFFEIGSFVTP